MDNMELDSCESWDLDWISEDVYDALRSEIEYQNSVGYKYKIHPHEIPSWITIIRWYLNLAEKEWMLPNGENYNSATANLRKAIATGIQALEQHGVNQRQDD